MRAHTLTPLVLMTILFCGVIAPAPPAADAAPLITNATTVPLSALALPDVFGIDLDDVVKAGGIVYVVDEFGPEINKAINAVLNNNNAATGASSKVVLIVTLQGKSIGAAQVTGPKAAVDKVRGVLQLEESFKSLVRFRVLIPVSTTNSASKIARVKGVAVSALIDTKL